MNNIEQSEESQKNTKVILWLTVPLVVLASGIFAIWHNAERKAHEEQRQLADYISFLESQRDKQVSIEFEPSSRGTYPDLVISDKRHSDILLSSLILVFRSVEGHSNSILIPDHPDLRIHIDSPHRTEITTVYNSPWNLSTSSLKKELYTPAEFDSTPAVIAHIMYLYYGLDMLSDKLFERAYYPTYDMLGYIKRYNSRPLKKNERDILEPMVKLIDERYKTLKDTLAPYTLPPLP